MLRFSSPRFAQRRRAASALSKELRHSCRRRTPTAQPHFFKPSAPRRTFANDHPPNDRSARASGNSAPSQKRTRVPAEAEKPLNFRRFTLPLKHTISQLLPRKCFTFDARGALDLPCQVPCRCRRPLAGEPRNLRTASLNNFADRERGSIATEEFPKAVFSEKISPKRRERHRRRRSLSDHISYSFYFCCVRTKKLLHLY